MKKLILIVLIVLLFFAGAFTLSGKQENKGENPYVEKTYFLKNISADFAVRSLQVYIVHQSTQGNILSVTIHKDKVKTFEELLNRIDIKRKKVTFRIFTIIGSHKGQSDKIKNKDLNKVLDELKEVLSIDTFKLDGVGSIVVLERSGRNKLSLASKSGLNLRLHLNNISINTDKSGTREVNFSFNLFSYIESSTSIKENGYLVAGVSKIGKNGDSLILVINTEIE